VSGQVIPLHGAGGVDPTAGSATRPVVGLAAAASAARAALEEHLDQLGDAMAANTKVAYRRQADAYLDWLRRHASEHPDAFVDQVGATSAVSGWRRQQLGDDGLAPATVNQGLAAVDLMYQVAQHLTVSVKRARVAKDDAPDALTRPQEAAVRRAADRRGPRDAAIVAVLLGTGARAEECARLRLRDVPATARKGEARLFGKGDQVRQVPLPGPARDRLPAWLGARAELLAGRPDLAAAAADAGDALWIGQRGVLTVDGVTDVVRAVGADARLPGLRPHKLRHTYATRLREGGADAAQIQALLGHANIATSARYFKASKAELADLIDRILDS